MGGNNHGTATKVFSYILSSLKFCSSAYINWVAILSLMKKKENYYIVLLSITFLWIKKLIEGLNVRIFVVFHKMMKIYIDLYHSLILMINLFRYRKLAPNEYVVSTWKFLYRVNKSFCTKLLSSRDITPIKTHYDFCHKLVLE